MQLTIPQPALPVLIFLALLSPAGATPGPPHDPSASTDPAAVDGGFKIEVNAPGVYRVGYEDFVAAGLDAAFLRSSALTLSRGGIPVPIRVEDGGDGRFGRGDWLEWVAWDLVPRAPQVAPGEATFLLQLSTRPGARMQDQPSGLGAGPRSATTLSRFRQEQDLLFLRFPGESPETSEVWYWARLTPHDDPGFSTPVALDDLDADSPRPVRLRLRFRGWSHLPRWIPQHASRPPPEMADHSLEIFWSGRSLGTVEWSNSPDGFVWESPPIAASELAGAGDSPELTLRIGDRTLFGDPVVDVVMLDWLEVIYPRRTAALGEQALLLPVEQAAAVPGAADAAPHLTLYTEDGRRLSGAAALFAAHREVASGPPSLEPAAASNRWSTTGVWAVPPGGLRSPRSVRRLRSGRLRDPDRRADYLMIAHPSLRWAVAPLAAAHRRRGLDVEVVDVRAIYDEFGHGVAGPHAIRDFLRWADANWRPPAPRYVLLVGDASWDTRNRVVRPFSYADRPYSTGRGATLGSRRAPRYESGSHRNHRNLVPTGSTATFEGHAASDAWLADLDDDQLPDLAIGRLPAADRKEAVAMVAKTLRYLESPRIGPWRREMLFISDGNQVIDSTSQRVSLALAAGGFSPLQVRPEESDASPEARRERLLTALDRGPLLVHFFGHGGRNIWRTGGSGGAADRDLFTLDDLDRLTPRDQLPIVLSMSCYSAPFDHPNADSIGEKFVRMPDRGAVAVIAASWRNTPAERWSRLLTEELTAGGPVGEALLRAKRRSEDAEFVGQYNLLGDPALPLQVPNRLEVRAALTRKQRLPMVVAELPHADAEAFAGQAIVEWLDRSGQTVERQEITVEGPELSAVFPGSPEQIGELATAQVYLWDEAGGRDALGAASISPPRNGAARGKVRVAGRTDRPEAEVRR